MTEALLTIGRSRRMRSAPPGALELRPQRFQFRRAPEEGIDTSLLSVPRG